VVGKLGEVAFGILFEGSLEYLVFERAVGGQIDWYLHGRLGRGKEKDSMVVAHRRGGGGTGQRGGLVQRRTGELAETSL